MTEEGARVIERPAGMPEWADLDVKLSEDVYVGFTCYDAQHHPTAPNPAGGFLIHRTAVSEKAPGGWCLGAFAWWRPESEQGRPIWTLHALEPLDLTPSFRCHCGFHGFIRQGRWIPA